MALGPQALPGETGSEIWPVPLQINQGSKSHKYNAVFERKRFK
ncbi:hypothetical protein CCACVL1_11236 [Corchorus capsularis]|uniref:Uncharacterized protein n=1 Tax=Corchorus capsularis TaxID=210143 RepID=A0A1R3IMD4_COCAP|nr:hypothetical protein CCACVL1_11236 [Corchorus capsularis]